MMQQRLPQNDAMMHHSTSETMRMAVRDTGRECLGEACRRCVCNQHQDWSSRTTAGATNTRLARRRAPCEVMKFYRKTYFYQLLLTKNHFLPPSGLPCPTVPPRAQHCSASAPSLLFSLKHAFFSHDWSHPRPAVSRIHQFQLFLLSARPPRQLFCGLCRRCLLFEGGQCAHRCHCRPRCFLHLLCWLRRWPVGLSEDFL